jgi:hypothetical protein
MPHGRILRRRAFKAIDKMEWQALQRLVTLLSNARFKNDFVTYLFVKTLLLPALGALLFGSSCTSPKTPYVSDAREPNDQPPSPRYSVVLMALRDELPRHGPKTEFYLCQGPEQVAVLQRDLPEFTLRHASETYTAPVKDWPGIFWSHRRSDDALATRVTIDIDTATADTITTTLWIGHQAPNLTQVHHTFRRFGTTWRLVRREEGPKMKI